MGFFAKVGKKYYKAVSSRGEFYLFFEHFPIGVFAGIRVFGIKYLR